MNLLNNVYLSGIQFSLSHHYQQNQSLISTLHLSNILEEFLRQKTYHKNDENPFIFASKLLLSICFERIVKITTCSLGGILLKCQPGTHPDLKPDFFEVLPLPPARGSTQCDDSTTEQKMLIKLEGSPRLAPNEHL